MADYDAFISYAHGSHDGLASALQSNLERFAKPWYRMRALRVFLDSSNLSASPGLWPSIEAALSSSRWFVLLVSADAVTSRGVNREVRWWLDHRGTERMLMVAAEPGLAWDESQADWATGALVPQALRGAFGHEPLWVDLSEVPLAGRRPTLPDDPVGALAAPVRGVQKDQLIGEHLRAHRRAMRLARTAVAILATLTILAVAAGLLAVRERDTAISQRNQAQSDALAAQSVTLDDTDPSTAALLAADAYQIAPTSQAQASLLDVLAQPDRGVIVTYGPGGAGTTSVNAVAFGRHGAVLATATDDSVRLWDTADRDPVGRPLRDAGGDEADAVAFSPGGTLLAAAFDGGQALIWNVAGQKRTGPALSCSDASPDALAFSPDGKLLAVVTQAGTVRLWHVGTWTADGAPFRMKSGGIQAVAFSPRGGMLATRTGTAVQLWRLASHSPFGAPMRSGEGASASVAFSPDGAVLAAAADGGGAQLWAVGTQSRLGKPVADSGVDDVAFSPDGQILATADTSGPVQLWHVKTQAQASAPLAAATGGVDALAFASSGELATGSEDGTARLWDTAVRTQQVVLASGVRYDGVSEVTFSPRGHRLATVPALRIGAIQTWNLGASPPTSTSIGSDQNAFYVAFSTSGQILATTGFGGELTRFWNPVTGRAAGHPPNVSNAGSVAFSPDGKLLVTTGNQTRLWDAASGQPIGRPMPAIPYPGAVAFSPDSRYLAAGGEAGPVRIWAVANQTQVSHAPEAGGVTMLAFSLDGRTLAGASGDGTVLLWNVSTAGQLTTEPPIAVGGGAVVSLAFSRDGKEIATASSDGTAQIWDTSTRSLIGAPLPAAGVNTVAFSPDGRTLATGGNFGDALILWNVALPANIRRAVCAIGGDSVAKQRLVWTDYVASPSFTEPFRPACE